MSQSRFLLSRRILAPALAVALGAAVGAQAPASAGDPPASAGRQAAASAPFALTIDNIMRGPELVGYPPAGLRWSGDSRRLYFEWRRPGEEETSTWVVRADGSGLAKLSDEERKLAPPATGGRWDRAHRRVVFADAGDLVLLDTTSGVRRQITRTSDSEGNPRWARGDTHVTFTRAGNLFIVPVAGEESGILTQLTDVGPRKPEPRVTESQKYLREEEKKLLDHVRDIAEKKQKREDKQKKDALPTLELREGQTALDLQLSPDGAHVFILVSERAPGAKSQEVPNYVTESAYPEMIPGRSNVGDAQEKRMLAILEIASGKSVWADAAFAQAPRPPETTNGSRDGHGNGNGDGNGSAEAAKSAGRDVRWMMPVLSRDGKYAAASVRAADNKDRWIVSIDPESGKSRVLEHTHDDAWIREAGRGFGTSPVEFLDDDRRVYFLSERDGWMHLYTADVSQPTGTAKQLTEGTFEIDNADLSGDGKTFYVTSTEQHSGERHVYSMPVDGGTRTRLTSMTGSNEGEVSPDGAMVGLVHSYSTRPPEVYLMPNRAGAAVAQVTTTPVEAWRRFKWIDPQLVTFAARDGARVSARVFRPEMIGAKPDPRKPGVVFVHGAGYLQNAHKYWSTYYREFMFHNLLASRGYVVLDVDYRASAGYGRDWRTAIYRHMGGKDLEDVVDGAKYLVASQGVSPRRIGVYGGSYGGFITLMAMFTTPDVFAAGAALRPVTDWAHYNHGYTSNILNIPQEDAEAYRRSSPIYFAEGLKGALLICHGMVDTNVFFQDTARLVQRLIELRKENWSVAPYPVENHSFEEATSWADEYKRILQLFETTLRGRSGT
jgi:dipeptidyl aminopeptidase/acylaminoacyl peptidase